MIFSIILSNNDSRDWFIIIVFKSIIIPCKHGLDCSCSGRSPLCTILGYFSSEAFYTLSLPWLNVPRFYGVYHVHYGHLCTLSQLLSSLLSMWPNQCRRRWCMPSTIGLMPTQAWSSSRISILHGYTTHPSNHWHLITVQPLRFFNFDWTCLTTMKHDATNACCI